MDRRVLPALRSLSLRDSPLLTDMLLRRPLHHNHLSSSAVYPAMWAMRDVRAGFLRQARLLSTQKEAQKLIAQQKSMQHRAQRELAKRVSAVTDTPLLEGGLYEYRQKQLRERTKSLWELRRQQKVKLRLQDPDMFIVKDNEPVIYVSDVDGVKSLFKFREADLPAALRRKPVRATRRRTLPEVARTIRTPKASPGMVTKWV